MEGLPPRILPPTKFSPPAPMLGGKSVATLHYIADTPSLPMITVNDPR
jgi:hypothetical protein